MQMERFGIQANGEMVKEYFELILRKKILDKNICNKSLLLELNFVSLFNFFLFIKTLLERLN